MSIFSDLLLDVSLLYRNSQKYFDSKLGKLNLGSGQVIFLFLINENEGINGNLLAEITNFDKSTITSSVQKLIKEGYVEAVDNEFDKRIKSFYTTEKASQIMNELYQVRKDYFKHLTVDIAESDLDSLVALVNNSKTLNEETDLYEDLKIGGIQKVTLLDYPGKVACTIFMGGCNFKCPYCHNSDLVFMPEDFLLYSSKEVFDYLKKRKNILDGVCISGGEPLLQAKTIDFIKKIKSMGYLVKLDTNGFFPDRLIYLIENKLIDYVAIDIKNSKAKYGETVGLTSNFNTKNIEQSVEYLMNCGIDYEFRTTVVDEYFDAKSFVEIGKWIKGAKKYYLQYFVESEKVIKKGLHPAGKEKMKSYLEIVKKDVENSYIRGE